MVQDILLKTEKRKYIKSSSFVMALLFTILCGLAALSFGYFITYFTTGHFIQSTEKILDTETRYIDAVGIENAKTQSDHLYILLDNESRLPDPISNNISSLVEGIIVFDDPIKDRRYAAKIHTLSDNRKLLIGTDITDISRDFKFMQWLGIASVLFIMVVVFISYLISLFVVSGTNKIADTARDIIETGDLSRRLDVGSQWDDLGQMTVVLNMLLDRIQDLMSGVKQVSDNIAHDLRTPLTRLRSNLENIKDEDQKHRLLDEADHLLNTFNALLRISRIESERKKSRFAPLNLKNLLRDVIEFYAPLAEDKTITLKTDLSDINLKGDADLLFQAFANLLDNAIKFTPMGGNITIRLFKNNNQIHIEMRDTGAGVDASELDKIFNRFYRGDTSRSSKGIGLGLSLVQAIIELHDGTIRAENAKPGLRVITIL